MSCCKANREDRQVKRLSLHPARPIFQYGLRYLDAHYAALRTPPAIDTWEIEFNELPTSYERIVYTGKFDVGPNHHVANARLVEQAAQVNPSRKIGDTALGEVEMDLKFVGAWVDNGDALKVMGKPTGSCEESVEVPLTKGG